MTAASLLAGSFHGRLLVDVHLERQAQAVAAQPKPPAALLYELPDGQIVMVPFDACKGRDVIHYLAKGGRTLIALLVSSEAEVDEARADWSSR